MQWSPTLGLHLPQSEPSTSVGASRLKEKLERATLQDFNHDVMKYNTWFENMREEITKEEGEGYSEYLRSMF